MTNLLQLCSIYMNHSLKPRMPKRFEERAAANSSGPHNQCRSELKKQFLVRLNAKTGENFG